MVNGQKIWTSHAQHADMMFCLVRTDPEAKKQRGISFLLIDMKSPGVTVRPIIGLDLEHTLNEVFFDDVRVPVENRIGEENSGYVIDGRKAVVAHAASADKIIVSCRTSGEPRDEDGISLFVVDQDAAGMTRQDYRTLDGQRASDIVFDGVAVGPDALLGEKDRGLAALERVVDGATCAVCAEAVGAMRAVNALTKDYIQTRQQFGAPIGDNQVLQHRLVDMNIATEEAKSLIDMTAMQMEDGQIDGDRRRIVTSATKAKIGEAGIFVGAQGIQLHGGIGMTDEYAVGHYYKRLMAIDMSFGNGDHHRTRFSRLT